MSDDRPDIQTREDCERLVRAFYGRALHDPLIGWIFWLIMMLTPGTPGDNSYGPDPRERGQLGAGAASIFS